MVKATDEENREVTVDLYIKDEHGDVTTPGNVTVRFRIGSEPPIGRS